jgi:hypothetical protein
VFDVLSCRLPGGNKENHEEPQDAESLGQNLNPGLPEEKTGFILNIYTLKSYTHLSSLPRMLYSSTTTSSLVLIPEYLVYGANYGVSRCRVFPISTPSSSSAPSFLLASSVMQDIGCKTSAYVQ